MTKCEAVPSNLIRRMWISVGGAILFLAVSTAHGALVPGFDPWHQSISALALAPFGWVQTVNFIVLGGSFLATVPASFQVFHKLNWWVSAAALA